METYCITGASRGIGLNLVQTALANQHNVIATYRGQPTDALNALTENPNLTLHPLEVTDEESIAAFAKAMTGKTIDVLINNAGIIGPEQQDYDTLQAEPWLNAFAVNTVAPLMVSRALLPQLQAAKHPRLITISSQMGALNSDSTGMMAYRTSKAAVNKVMQLLSVELKDQGITVCPMHPGWVQTDMGGPNGDITPDVSAKGLLNVIEQLTPEQSGRFLTYEGKVHPW